MDIIPLFHRYSINIPVITAANYGYFQEIDSERQARAEQEFMTQKLLIKVEELQSQIYNKDFKSEHYDEVLW